MKRPANQIIITGESGNTYAHGMVAVLGALGTEVDYDSVMGLSGVAFILQVDTSGPYLPGEVLDCAWWPNDAWGFYLGLPVLSAAVGWELRNIHCDAAAYKADPTSEYRRAFASLVESALHDGKPVLAEADHCFIVTRTDGQVPPLLGYGTVGKSTSYQPEPIRINMYPWGLCIIGKKLPVSDSRSVDVTSLRHILALYHETAQGANAPKTRFSGKRAWLEWERLLDKAMANENKSNCMSPWDNNMLIHLRYNRASAVAYLQAMKNRHTGDTASALGAACVIYQSIVQELEKAELPYPGPTKGGISAYRAMVARVATLEATAMAQLEVAVKSLEKTH
ncbi:MAG: hypothetical protein SFY80_14150 [Verrucomicrobiota bacterium]|nr:hypothetical protein [Verrucomicrobiota bacterium]